MYVLIFVLSLLHADVLVQWFFTICTTIILYYLYYCQVSINVLFVIPLRSTVLNKITSFLLCHAALS